MNIFHGSSYWSELPVYLINSFLVSICFAFTCGGPSGQCSIWFSVDYKLFDSFWQLGTISLNTIEWENERSRK